MRRFEEEWVCLRDSVKICADEVCGKENVRGVRIDDIRRHINVKKKLFEQYLQTRNRRTYEIRGK